MSIEPCKQTPGPFINIYVKMLGGHNICVVIGPLGCQAQSQGM